MIAYFLFTDLLGLGWQWHDGLLDRQAIGRALLYAQRSTTPRFTKGGAADLYERSLSMCASCASG